MMQGTEHSLRNWAPDTTAPNALVMPRPSDSHQVLTQSTLCPKKNIPNIFDSNLKTNYQILIIFGIIIPDITCHQTTFQFPTSPNVCFCTT